MICVGLPVNIIVHEVYVQYEYKAKKQWLADLNDPLMQPIMTRPCLLR